MLETIERKLAPVPGPTHAILRMGAALLFMQHGAMKVGLMGGMDGSGGTVDRAWVSRRESRRSARR